MPLDIAGYERMYNTKSCADHDNSGLLSQCKAGLADKLDTEAPYRRSTLAYHTMYMCSTGHCSYLSAEEDTISQRLRMISFADSCRENNPARSGTKRTPYPHDMQLEEWE